MRAIQLTLALCLICAHQAYADSITFNSDANGDPIVHGQIIDTEFAGSPFQLTVSADNVSDGPDIAVAFDSTLSGTADPDLEDPWTGGNIDHNAVLGNLLIIQERPSSGDPDSDNDGIVDVRPNDEGSRPAGSITFDFSGGSPLESFGMTIVDIEANELSGYALEFYNGGTQVGGAVDLMKFITPGNPFYDSSVDFAGDNTANILQPVTLAKLSTEFGGWGITPFDKVVVSLGGSGALGEINYSRVSDSAVVPEPTSLALLATGALGFMGYGWRRKRKLAA